jgi:broad specificity phosphatase PhoE
MITTVRHGETEWSLSGQHTGKTDLPLTAAGRERATALAPMFASREFALVLCSPLLRARETCSLAGFDESLVELCDDLEEWDYGAYEGLTTPQIRERDPDWDMWRDGCPDGETPPDVGARADRVIERLRAADGDAIAFAHGHILRVLGARWIELPVAGGSRLYLGTGSVSELGYERETAVIRNWNLMPEADAGSE